MLRSHRHPRGGRGDSYSCHLMGGHAQLVEAQQLRVREPFTITTEGRKLHLRELFAITYTQLVEGLQFHVREPFAATTQGPQLHVRDLFAVTARNFPRVPATRYEALHL